MSTERSFRLGYSTIAWGHTDLDEVLALSDRIAVMLNGRLVDIVPSGTSRQVIGKMMVG